jgi:integrase
VLREYLLEHKLRIGRHEGLMFGPNRSDPFNSRALTERADKAWEAASLERITLHECRHTAASLWIAAGVNIGAVSAFLGHASVKVTWDVYHHLMPGTEDEATELLDTHLAAQRDQAEDAARRATGTTTGTQGSETAASPLEHAESGS